MMQIRRVLSAPRSPHCNRGGSVAASARRGHPGRRHSRCRGWGLLGDAPWRCSPQAAWRRTAHVTASGVAALRLCHSHTVED